MHIRMCVCVNLCMYVCMSAEVCLQRWRERERDGSEDMRAVLIQWVRTCIITIVIVIIPIIIILFLHLCEDAPCQS